MEFQLRKRAGQSRDARHELVAVGDDKIIASTSFDADGKRRERFQVMTVRDGKIADIQGCSTRREAERFARSA